jgi:hypothetical protein
MRAYLAALAALILAGCSDDPRDPRDPNADFGAERAVRCAQKTPDSQGEPPPAIGLMTSLPLTYPLGADFAAFAQGEVERTWQGKALSQCYTAMPLDTLAPIGGLDPGAPATNPLSGLAYVAVIQPRGLSPRDNVALDDWVRAGGKLLLVLDPMLTGEYDLPLGDPRRPGAVAFIPPVVERWGMTVIYDENQMFAPRQISVAGLEMQVLLAGDIAVSGGDCVIERQSPIKKCAIGKGSVTLVADAAIFEDQDLAGSGAEAIHALLAFAFDR